MKKLILAAAITVAAMFPTSALAGTFSGVVVGKGGGNLAIASGSGLVRTVHSRANVRIGARVHVNGRAVRVVGRAHRARIHAIVVRRAGGTTLLAAGRSLLAVRSGRRFASAAGSGPSTGAVVNTTVGITNGQMTQQTMQIVGQTGKVNVQAQITGVNAGSITVLVNGQSFSIPLPAGIQLPTTLVGQFVTLTLNLAQAGPTANADDENEDEDNDDQGEDESEDHGHDQADDDHGHDQGDDEGDDDHGGHGGHGGDDDD